jgi:hypothetical protein
MSRVLVFRVGRRFWVGENWGCRPPEPDQGLALNNADPAEP